MLAARQRQFTFPRRFGALVSRYVCKIKLHESNAETDDAELGAKSALLAVEPTIEAAIALLRYASVVSEYVGHGTPSWETQCFRHVADALAKITRG
jgi:hypothetical protein